MVTSIPDTENDQCPLMLYGHVKRPFCHEVWSDGQFEGLNIFQNLTPIVKGISLFGPS